MKTLTLRTWITFFGLAILMGLNNIYSVLLTGWGEGGSIIAVILSLLFLAKKERNIINYNLGQTMASSGGCVGFAAAILASIYYIKPDWNPPLFQLALMVMGVSTMGVALAAPLRNTIVHWFFPPAVACATILKAITSEDHSDRDRARTIMGISGLLSAALTLPTKASLTKGGSALWHSIPLSKGLSISLDPLLYGVGMIVGPRIGISMLTGGLLHYFLFIPYFRDVSADFGRWAAVGFMMLPAFTSMIFALWFEKKHVIPPGFHPKDNGTIMTGTQWGYVFLTFLVALVITIFSMNSIFEVSPIYVILSAGIAAPLCFALGKVSGETGMNPVRLLAILLLMIFSITGSFSAVALLGIGAIGASMAAIAVDLFIDLRTGYLINANPKQQIVVQFLAVIPVSFATVYFLHILAQNFGFGEGQYFPAPGAVVWASMAELFTDGSSRMTPFIWKTLLYTSIAGVIMSLLENSKKFQAFTPSPFALGISFLIPIEMLFAICIGSVARVIVIKISPNEQQAKEDCFQVGSAIFAASALAGIITVTLITLGVLYLPL